MSISNPSIIPAANPRAAYLARREAIDAAMRRVLESGRYILDTEVECFEQEFARWLGARYCVGVGNGTDAVELALRAVGVGPGDEVVAPAHTASATIAAIERLGAVALLVDIEAQTFGLDPQKLCDTVRAAASRGRLRAIVVVHLYGHAAHIDDIVGVAREADLFVIEDCAQAHGAKWRGRQAGTFGHAAAFSFYPTKNLGALGDGGAVVTDDTETAARVRMLRQYGWRERYSSETAGFNSRLDELQAAVLRARLGWLDDDNARRRSIAARLDAAFRSVGRAGPVVRVGAEHVYHQYSVLRDDRDAWRAALQARGVGSSVLYPHAIHQQPGHAGRLRAGVGGFDASERVCREVVCLPVFPELTGPEVDRIAGAIEET